MVESLNTVTADTVTSEAATSEAVTSDVSSPQVNSVNGSSAGLAGLDVRHLAAEGYFQAIAYWLNERLIPQNVYAQVLADQSPGCIKVLVEFERPPEPKRLLKFVCDRIYKLNSNVIEGIHLIVRAVGSRKTDWEQRIRIPTGSARQAKAAISPARSQAPVRTELDTSTPLDSPALQVPTPQLAHESSRSKVAREIVRSQFKFFRAALISGTASAAFLFGGLTELVLSDRLSAPTVAKTVPVMAPWYEGGSIENGSQAATAVAFTAADQSGDPIEAPSQRFNSRTVEAALETVAVSPHDAVAYPNDPTVTLLFGGELELDDFIFEDTESLDHLFSDLSIYQQSDVAMVGLSEPLATASTSLQESFYNRTRPQAVQALQKGGIDIVSLASAGSLTYGARGLDETLRTLDRQGLYRVGAGRNQLEAHRPEILDVKGQRIAYLGYNSEALKAAKADQAGIALTSSEERSHILEDIRAIRPQVDWIVVNYRWGDTLNDAEDVAGQNEANSAETSSAESAALASGANPLTVPQDWQRSLAHEAVDAGADLVVGYHPDQIQGAEIYRDRAIAYSLGDFVFGEAPFEDHDTAALRVSLRNHQMKIEFLPISIRNSQLQMATGEHGTQILQGIRNASSAFEQPLHFPTVLQASPPASSMPSPVTEPDLPQGYTEPDSAKPDLLQDFTEPDSTESDFTEPGFTESDFIDTTPTAVPVAPESETIEYEDPAPHPILRESEALFPAETEDNSSGTSDDSFIELVPPEDEAETQSVLPSHIEPDNTDSGDMNLDDMSLDGDNSEPDSIEAYEEPLTGPLSAL